MKKGEIKSGGEFGRLSLSLPYKSLLGYAGKKGDTGKREGGVSVGVYNLGKGIFNEGRSLQVTSSPAASPLSPIFL